MHSLSTSHLFGHAVTERYSSGGDVSDCGDDELRWGASDGCPSACKHIHALHTAAKHLSRSARRRENACAIGPAALHMMHNEA
jgi:hypothetical protein